MSKIVLEEKKVLDHPLARAKESEVPLNPFSSSPKSPASDDQPYFQKESEYVEINELEVANPYKADLKDNYIKDVDIRGKGSMVYSNGDQDD